MSRRSRVICRAIAGLETLEPRRLLANIVVDTAIDENINDNPTTSLREAIAQASLLGSDDLITFDPEIFAAEFGPHTISLLDGALSVPAGGGQITIDGPGDDAATLRIEKGGGERVFELDAGADVIIRDLTIQNTDEFFLDDGAAIFNEGTLLLGNINLSGNTVLGQPGGVVRGGAIFSSGTLTIEDSRVTDNTVFGGGGSAGVGPTANGGSSEGGAIYATGDLTIRRSHFENNIASAGDGGLSPLGGGTGGNAFGGAIYVLGGALLIEDSTFTLNQALGGPGRESGEPGTTGGDGGHAFGGAIVNIIDPTTLLNVAFDDNAARGGEGGDDEVDGDGGIGHGGALYTGGALAVEGGSFFRNIAAGGDSVPHGIGNAAGGGAYGGAIHDTGGAADITLARFEQNEALGGESQQGGEGAGGAVYSNGGGLITITDTTLDWNRALGGESDFDRDGAAARGGGIAIENGGATISRSTISNSVAFASDAGSVGQRGGDALGGAIYNAGTLRLLNSTITDSQSLAGSDPFNFAGEGGDALGGGVYNHDGADLTAVNVTIFGNRLLAGRAGTGTEPNEGDGTDGKALGGGIYNAAGATAAVTNAIVAHNPTDSGAENLYGQVTLVHSLLSQEADAGYTELPGSGGNIVVFGINGGPLQDNGGPTQTILPNPGSLAIDNGNDDAAIAAFGEDGVDQRGFARFVGTAVDIGAVEVQPPPQIQVQGNNNVIANNDTWPSSTDHTNFGSVAQGATGPTRTYTVTNVGEGTLELSTPTLPFGYVITEALDGELEAGESDTFTVRLTTVGSPGWRAGNIGIASNDPDDALFEFRVTGRITQPPSPPPPPAGETIKINFQPLGRPVPAGYFADTGIVFGDRGNGLSYGWNKFASPFTRDRDTLADQRLDTFVHMQYFGPRTWEIAVPNGAYSVKIVAGEPDWFDSVYKINVEGQLTVNGTPTSSNRFITGTKIVNVTDGKLTVSNASGSLNNRLAYIEITPVVSNTVKINFQPLGRPVPAGYLADTGIVFGDRGNGHSYGWNKFASPFTRDRDTLADQRLDTFVHMQYFGPRTWELAVANGTYSVKVVAGEPDWFDSIYKINVEGQLTVNGTPTSSNRFITGTKTVTVSDGRLTVSNASGSLNNRLAYIEVTRV